MKPSFIYGTEAQVLALTPGDPHWVDLGFYYPQDKPYFYQLREGVMVKIGDGNDDDFFGYGILLNDKVIGGIKILIEQNDILTIPQNYDYNTFKLGIEGVVNCSGNINIM